VLSDAGDEEEEEAEGGGDGRDRVHQAWSQARACSRDIPAMSARNTIGLCPSIETDADEEEVVAARVRGVKRRDSLLLFTG
jgi:hypothetical protein